MTKKISLFLGLLACLGLVMFLYASIGFKPVEAQTNLSYFPNITIGRDLTVGSTGQDVVVLQGLLSEMGYLEVPLGVPLGYYGKLTQSAVARYQEVQGVYPSSGYYGSATKSAMRSHFNLRGWLTLLGW